MFHLHCPRCGAWTVVQDLRDPDAALKCGCCTLDHHHGQAANACTDTHLPVDQRHGGAPCPHPSPAGADCERLTEAGQPCPGAHCGPGVPGCTVCRPIVITPLPGSVKVGAE
jgi:hypothetical protein